MSSPKVTKAAAFLNSISADEGGDVIPVLKPKQINDNETASKKTLVSPTASPIKKSERPLTSVQQMIKAKEQESKENRALDFTPRPDNKSIKDRRNVFVKQQETNIESDKLSKSEINRMGVINNAMSNSPSKKNLNKLKDIQSRLEHFSPVPNKEEAVSNSKTSSVLPKTFSTKNINKNLTTPSSIAIKTWLDTDRDNLKLAAYVCRMVEIKNWIENLLSVDLLLENSDIDQFPDYLSNGILLAQIAQYFDPEHIKRIYTGLKPSSAGDEPINYKMTTKQFKYIENIVQFLDFSRRVKLPSLFIFETNDLYEKKDIPKVIACLHALSCLMAMLGRSAPVEKLAEGEEVSKALLALNVNVDKLKQIKHKVGRFGGTLGRKYVEGFDEAVRVNVGDDIRKLQLVQIPQNKSNKEKTPEVENTSKASSDVIFEPKSSAEEPDEILLSVSDNNDKSLLSYDFDKTDLDLGLSDTQEGGHGSSGDNFSSSTMSSPSSPSSPIILPPSAKDQEYTRDARLLFNKSSMIPSMPSVHSISEIQKKYQFLIDEEERELLGGILTEVSFNNEKVHLYNNGFAKSSLITPPQTADSHRPSSPDEDLIRLQSLARGYLLRFDLFVTKAILKGNTSSVISFQSICRGIMVRQKLNLRKKNTVVTTDAFIDIDALDLSSLNEYGNSEMMKTILKNKRRHGELLKNLSSLRENQTDISNLQSSIRGMFMRQKYWEIRKFLLHEMNLVIKLQSVIRGDLTRAKIKDKSYFRKKLFTSKTDNNETFSRKNVNILDSPTKKAKVKPKRVSHANDDQNPLIAPYDENELFEQFDIPTAPSRRHSSKDLHESSRKSPRKKPVYGLQERYELPEPGKVPRRKETRRENAKYIPNLPIEEPLTPPKEKKSLSRLQHSPTKVSLSEFVIQSESRLSSTNTVLFKDSKANQNMDDIVTTEQMAELDNAKDDVTELQSHIRGALTRRRLNKFIDKIYDNEQTFLSFVALAKGVLIRKTYKELRKELSNSQNEIITLQSILRGIESRVDHDCLIEDICDSAGSVINLQSEIRGFLVRTRIRDREAWFQKPENLIKICRLQAIIRGLHGVQDYKTLIEERNPPVRAVKKFIGVLGGLEAEKTTREELDIMKLREEIKSEKNHVKEELKKLSKLKTKVEILRKNGINIKNVEGGLKNNVNAGNAVLTKLIDVEDIIGGNNSKFSNDVNTEVITKRESDLLNECIGSFFYILQAKPEYWARVLNYIEMTGDLVEFSHGHIEDWILKCFNYRDNDTNAVAEQTREECLYVKLIICTFNLHISRLSDDSYKRMIKRRRELENSDVKYWELLLHAYLNLPPQRTLTKTLLGDAVFLITSDDEVSFECDPWKIFSNLVESSDKITEAQKINVDVGNLEPLDISCVEKEYVKNMQNLRASVYEIFKYLKKIVSSIPIYIKCLCREFYEALKSNKNVSDSYHLEMVGIVFIQCYVLPIFRNPANFSIDLFAISDDLAIVETITRNIELASILLNQCVLMRHFDVDQYPYLISLNPFIDELSGQMKEFINELIDVPLTDVSYRKIMLESSQENMILKIQYDDIGELVCIWKEFLNEIFGDHGDLLYYSIKEIEESLGIDKKKGIRKLPCDQYGYTNIKLVDDKEEGVEKIVGEAMMLEVKKYMIYILQVQDGKDLVDLLVSEIEPADELKFKEIVKEEKKLLKRNSDQPVQILEKKSIDQIHNSSFPQVKKHALELIFELEKLGMISQRDGYQNLLNDIANEIRNKRKQQESRDAEKAVIVETLTELKRRSRTYQKKYEEYENTIRGVLNEHLMKGVQNEEDNPDSDESGKQSKAFLSKLFSRSGRRIKKRAQALHKSKNGSGNALYGQHKMTLKHLMDKGVIRTVGDGIESMGSSGGFTGFTGSSKLNRVNVVFCCNKPGYFTIELTNSSEKGVFNVTLDELLIWQYEDQMDVKAFDGEVVFFSGGLLKFILGNFYNV